jgi:hypothetical protein
VCISQCLYVYYTVKRVACVKTYGTSAPLFGVELVP